MPPAPPKPIPFTNYGGLLLSKPLDDVGADNAIDLLDVDWRSGVLHSRDGAEIFTAKAAADNYEAISAHSDSKLIATRNGVLVAIDVATKEEIAAEAAIQTGIHPSFAHLGTPNGSFTYIADSWDTLKRFDGAEFTSPTAIVDGVAGKAMPRGAFLTPWPDQGNRLVVCGTTDEGGPGGAASNESYVWFSNPGNAEEYESTAYVRLDPGGSDAEFLAGCALWNGQIFIVKETRLFVFYGVTIDASAEDKPIFNFRTVDLGTRVPSLNIVGKLVIAGTEGVYFISNDGLWVTTGGEPTLLSEGLNPLALSQELIGPAAETFGDLRWTDVKDVVYYQNAVYIGLGAELAITLLLKLDLATMRWTVYTANLRSMTVWNEDATTHRQRLFFTAFPAAQKHICFYTPAQNTDPIVDMDPRWQSGFYDLDNPDEKTLVHAKMQGSGDVDLEVAEDFGALGAATTFNLGAAGAIDQDQKQKGQTATLFSHRLSGVAPWSVLSLTRYLRETRVPETQKP